MPNRPVQSDAAATGGETEEERGAEGRGGREQGGGQKGEKDLKEGWRWGGRGKGGAQSHTHTMQPPSGHALHEKHPPPPDGPGSRRRRG